MRQFNNISRVDFHKFIYFIIKRGGENGDNGAVMN